MGIKYGTQELRNRWNYDRGNEYGTQEIKRGAWAYSRFMGQCLVTTNHYAIVGV